MQQAIKHADAIKLLRSQARQQFRLGILVGVTLAGVTLMVALIVAQHIYV